MENFEQAGLSFHSLRRSEDELGAGSSFTTVKNRLAFTE
jgi:hypothetical protein